ncbi:MAG TPA: malate synthase G, partial [Brevundimonas sp.]|nr:malate synthase G [Brevundimonas sp.]
MPVRADLTVAPVLAAFVEQEVLPGLGIEAGQFWTGVRTLLDWAVPENRRLLAVRDDLQARIDSWHVERKGQPYDVAAQRDFLKQIGWLIDAPAPYAIGT